MVICGDACLGTNGAAGAILEGFGVTQSRLPYSTFQSSRCYARRDGVCPLLAPYLLFSRWISAAFSPSFLHDVTVAMNVRPSSIIITHNFSGSSIAAVSHPFPSPIPNTFRRSSATQSALYFSLPSPPTPSRLFRGSHYVPFGQSTIVHPNNKCPRQQQPPRGPLLIKVPRSQIDL